ncbi:MAG: hypothetical protein ABUK01_01545 [Leptospirales bacterium]
MGKQLFYIFIAVVAITTGLLAQDPFSIDFSGISGLTAEARYEQKKLTKAIADSQYADAELDMLHKRANVFIPYISSSIKDNQNGIKELKLDIDSGEGYRWNGEKYLFTSIILLTIEDDKLKEVKLQYDRFNPYGGTFLLERRELINPTPFSGDNLNADPNDDLIIVYSEASDAELTFEEKDRFVFTDLDRHRDRTGLVLVYKQYMRKAIIQLENKVKNEKTSKRADRLYMIELE